MSKYELGKDIAAIQHELNKLTAEFNEFKQEFTSKCRGTPTSSVLIAEYLGEREAGQPIVFRLSKVIQDEECRCKSATLTLYPDGRYEFRSSQKNMSSILDPQGGDTHEMNIEIYEGGPGQHVYSFSASKFVAGGKTKPLNKDGSDNQIKEKFSNIGRVWFEINCA